MAQILIIDDERFYSTMLSTHLASRGYDVAIMDSGREGLTYANTHPGVDLILLDLMMPDMYGLDVLFQLKNNPALRHIPVILQTGMLTEDEIHKGITMGAAYCLRKPFSRKELFATVANILMPKENTHA